ncbi:sulfur carrier protein ThiS [Fluviicoccus keumensis]|uniref:Sulfur carrier protein ThiS n=1 Tax=Fluviicoccus keumensis TaxID=1435465 RepID=A0A4Q7ZAW2_9GAMM|nr:sulfur carrier protein ThiS [Fluviicoccus keumensis]RZU46939.1 sulfur carrier protein ThiS [Fluviicoccus keumensis]
MQILVNGAPQELIEGSTVLELLQQLELTGKRLAVEVNANIVPRSRHAETRLQPGDKVEIVHAIGGG